MSDAFALAAVTAVLRRRLLDRVADSDLASIVGAVEVSVVPPDRVGPSDEPTQLNLYLHHVTPNAAYRNAGLPARDGRGHRSGSPPLALDLHYLVTAYGDAPYTAEMLLGHAMQTFHETPLLTRDEVRGTLNPSPPDPTLPEAIGSAGLADQIEQVRLTLEAMSSEESSRLWSALQARYRMTASYLATVVLIEPDRPGAGSLPVSSIGTVSVDPRRPVVRSVTVGRDPAAPAFVDSVLTIRGHRLRGDVTTLLVGGVEVEADELTFAGDEIRVDLGALTDHPAAGVTGVQVKHAFPLGSPPVPHELLLSNVVPVVLRPIVGTMSRTVTPEVVIDGVPYVDGTVTAALTPPVPATARVAIVLNAVGATSPGAAVLLVPPGNGVVPPATTTTVTAPFTRLVRGDYVGRVQVDGAESVPGMTGGVYATPMVTL